jgi:hypothetical protein
MKAPQSCSLHDAPGVQRAGRKLRRRKRRTAEEDFIDLNSGQKTEPKKIHFQTG